MIKFAMRIIVGLELDEQNGYAFQAFFGELNGGINSHNIIKLAT